MALQTQEQPLSRQGWVPVSSSTSSPLNPLSSLCIVFGPHFILNYLICNCFLVSDGFLGLSWFLFKAPVKNHITISFSIFHLKKIFLAYFSGVTLQSLLSSVIADL